MLSAHIKSQRTEDIEYSPSTIPSSHVVALIMKLICVEVLAIQQPTLLRSYVTSWASQDDNDILKEELEALESGGIFARLDIRNFLESDFFG